MKPRFPILNISLALLNLQNLEDIHIGDLWDYPRDNGIFNKYYLNQEYVDQNGHIFKLIGKKRSNFIHTIVHFNKYELIFVYTEQSIDLISLKNLLICRYSTLDNDFYKSILINLSIKSNTFHELIG